MRGVMKEEKATSSNPYKLKLCNTKSIIMPPHHVMHILQLNGFGRCHPCSFIPLGSSCVSQIVTFLSMLDTIPLMSIMNTNTAASDKIFKIISIVFHYY